MTPTPGEGASTRRRKESRVAESVRLRVQRGSYSIEAEGPTEFVERHVKTELESWLAAPHERRDVAEVQSREPHSNDAPAVRLKDFVKEKGPSGHPETATLLAYWAKEREGVASLGKEALEDLYKRAGLKRPTNPLNIMAKAASANAWFRSLGDGRYELTSTGEDHVSLDLPKSKK